ncbi:DUF1214 domain-containing protein [Bradyrhizobium sp. 27S5]|uniref:DUF1214 domain-containing protein n=1 Tax=Bradyrhizobium sp. 27S5 TaxID=3139728 RepID=UPI0030CF440D
MRHISKAITAAFCVSTVLAAPSSPAAAQQAATVLGVTPDEKTVADAYIYLLGRVLVIRQEHIDRKGEGFAYNKIKYNPLGSADFVNPNFDVAYLEAWFAVDDKTPVILEVPEIKGRYYTAQILDEWGEVIANINERIFPTKPYGKFALVKPGSSAKIPADAGRIELHSSKAKMLGRVELKGDPDGAVKLQRAFTVTALGKPAIAPPPAIPMFSNVDLIGVEIFDDVDAKLGSALDVSPNAAEMQQKVRAVAAYVASGKEARASIDAQLKKVSTQFREDALTKTAPYVNHWLCASSGGNYGAGYRLRSSANYAGIWANNPAEVVYFPATRDANEQPLNGSNSYVMHFPANGLPQSVVDAYWSVILVGVPDYRVVQNPLKRYNFNNHSPLVKEADGSLKIGIGAKPVAGVPEANWLPAADGKPFSLTFRTYVPKEPARTCEWTPPALTKVN